MNSRLRTSSQFGFTRPAALIAGREPQRQFNDAANVAAPNRGSTRVLIAAENKMLSGAITRALAKQDGIQVCESAPGEKFMPEMLADKHPAILLLSSASDLASDLAVVRAVRTLAPDVQILMVGMNGDESEFIQYVRAGVRGYLRSGATMGDVVSAIRRLQSSEAVCPGEFCALLFRCFEREATELPSASLHQKLRLTRREQQIVPFIARGLTNKEIANQFCLSEQTVKNHLYRMKQKVGAGDRLGIVQMCRSQGFLI
jgi:two-component system, NarL family, nitrate/nitrite response regulator NarL